MTKICPMCKKAPRYSKKPYCRSCQKVYNLKYSKTYVAKPRDAEARRIYHKKLKESKLEPVFYQIINTVTGYVYVGSTEYFAKRISHHRFELKNGIHKNSLLQEAYNRHGPEAFIYSIVKSFKTMAEAIKVESEFIVRHYNTLYNLNRT